MNFKGMDWARGILAATAEPLRCTMCGASWMLCQHGGQYTVVDPAQWRGYAAWRGGTGVVAKGGAPS